MKVLEFVEHEGIKYALIPHNEPAGCMKCVLNDKYEICELEEFYGCTNASCQGFWKIADDEDSY